MTKRMLSLLLALVMTLSLCVPALAADEFAAEAVTEVEEQAPAAPVEPEAPEAEEPVEAPAADEPMAEEADAPEMAALMEEEDLPLLVALGEISHAAHLKLEEAVEAAKPYKTRVDAGELYCLDDDDATLNDYDDGDPATDFNDAYENAVLLLTDGLNGVEVGEDVTDDSLVAAATKLRGFIPTDGSDNWSLAPNHSSNGLSNVGPSTTITVTGAATNFDLYPDQYYDANGDPVDNTYGASAKSDGISLMYDQAGPTYSSSTVDPDTFDDYPWTEMYRTNYLTAMKAAAKAAKAYNAAITATTQTFKDFFEVKKLLKAAEALEQDAALPNSSESTKLANLLKEYDAAIADPTKQSAYVDAATSFSGFTSKASAAKDLFDQTYTGLNGFKMGVTYWDYAMALKDLQKLLTKKSASAEFIAQDITDMQNVQVYVGIPLVTDGTTPLDNDGTFYGYSVQIDGKYVDASGAATKTKTIMKLSDNALAPSPWNTDPGHNTFDDDTIVDDYRAAQTGAINIVPFASGTFTKDSKVVLTLYKAYSYKDNANTTHYAWSDIIVDTYTFKFPADGYYGPEISTKAGAITVDHDPGSTSYFTYTALGQTPSANSGNAVTVTVKLDDQLSTYATEITKYKMAIVGSNGKDIGYVDESEGGQWTTPSTVTEAEIDFGNATHNDEYKIVASDMQLKFSTDWHDNNVDKDLAVHAGGTAKVTFESITKWSGMTDVKKMIADAKALVQGDYELISGGPTILHGTIKTVGDAWTVINRDINALQGYVNGGTYANTKANREAIIQLAADLTQVYNYLKIKDVSREDVQKLVEKAEEFDPPEDYTYESWKALQKAIEKAQKALATGLQSDLNAAYAALNSAIAGMTKEGEVDKTALRSAIAKAGALVEADYTPESWAANKAAIDEAKAAAQLVADNADATQAQVNTALNTLNGAMDKLVRTAPAVLPPAGGTGWRFVPETGDDYYFVDYKMVTNYWAGKSNGGSKWNLWYYLGSDGKLVKGFNYIEDDNGTGWYMLEEGLGDTRGQMLTGWQNTGVAGNGWFNPGRGVDHGKCTYTASWGDYNATTGLWADGLSHR